MSNGEVHVVTGQIVEEELTLTLEQLSVACDVERESIVELIEQGVIDRQSGGLFSGEVLRRARIAVRLQRDLGLNAAGASLVLELLERIEALEARNRKPGY